MDEDEVNDEILGIHGYISEGDSDDGGKTELDDFYYYHKPPPIDIDPNKHNIITGGVTKIPKNQLKRLRKKFADDETNDSSDFSQVGTSDSQFLTKSQKKRLRRRKNVTSDSTLPCNHLKNEQENHDEKNESSNVSEVGTPDSRLTKRQRKNLRIKKKLSCSESSHRCGQNVTQLEEEENPDDVATKRSIPEDLNLLQEDLSESNFQVEKVQFENNKPKKGRSLIDLSLLWLRNSCDLRTVASIIVFIVVLKKMPYFYHYFHKRN